jgi:hypothetical protein
MGTQVRVPDWIPQSNEMDLYEPSVIYGGDGRAAGNPLEVTEITLLHNMNRVLATQRGLVIENPMVPGQ